MRELGILDMLNSHYFFAATKFCFDLRKWWLIYSILVFPFITDKYVY